MWIGLGVVTPIVRILNTSKGVGKRKSREINGASKHKEKKVVRTDEEEARLQAIIIVGSLAQGTVGMSRYAGEGMGVPYGLVW